MAANAIVYCHPQNIRRQASILYVWHPKEQGDLNTIHEKNNVIKMPELASAKKKLRQDKHTCLVMKTEHLRAYKVVS